MGSEFGDSLGTFRDGMFGEFTWENETNGSLDFTGRESGLLVETGQFSGFTSDTFKDVVDEGVEDRHTLLGDTNFRVDLLQYLVDVDVEGFLTGLVEKKRKVKIIMEGVRRTKI